MSTRSAIHRIATIGRRAMLLAMGAALVLAHSNLHAQTNDARAAIRAALHAMGCEARAQRG